MLKIAGAFLIIASASGIGMSFGADLKKRSQELRILKQLVCMLRGEIKYTKAPLSEAFLHISARIPEPFGSFLASAAEEMEKADGQVLGDIWSAQIKKKLSGAHLNRTDQNQLETLGEMLGYLDLEMQLSAIDLYLEQLEGNIREADAGIGTRQKLYQTLGVAGGIFLVILLI